jgi:hypothetical protein
MFVDSSRNTTPQAINQLHYGAAPRLCAAGHGVSRPKDASQTDSTMRGGGRRTAAPARLAVVGWTIADVCCVAAACSDMCVLADV